MFEVHYLRNQLLFQPEPPEVAKTSIEFLRKYEPALAERFEQEFKKPIEEREIPPRYFPDFCLPALEEVEKYAKEKLGINNPELARELSEQALVEACAYYETLPKIVASAKGRMLWLLKEKIMGL